MTAFQYTAHALLLSKILITLRMRPFISVSYTHLDVYKRQLISFISATSTGVCMFLIGIEMTAVGTPFLVRGITSPSVPPKPDSTFIVCFIFLATAVSYNFLDIFLSITGLNSTTAPLPSSGPVSYTHLDVYKRQTWYFASKYSFDLPLPISCIFFTSILHRVISRLPIFWCIIISSSITK